MKPLLFLSFICLIPLMLSAQNSSSFPERDVEVTTPQGTLKGTMLAPEGATTCAIIIAGSGPTDRNGNNQMMTNNSLKMLAELLAEQGIASIRYDKRGIAASNDFDIQEEDMRFDSLVNDAVRWVHFARETGGFDRIIIAGHSEGSLIGMIAARLAEADAFISLAGAGRPADIILKEQLANQGDMVTGPSYPIIDSLKAGNMVDKPPFFLNALFRKSVQPYLISWFAWDPATEIARLDIPVLILQGLNDTQVKQTDAEALAAAKPDAKLALLPGVTHVLKPADNDIAASNKTLNQPDLPLAASVQETIVSFLKTL